MAVACIYKEKPVVTFKGKVSRDWGRLQMMFLVRSKVHTIPLAAEFYCSLEEGCSGESCSGGVQISAERRISRRATCLVLVPLVFNRYAEHLRKPFFCSGGILETRRAPRGCWSAGVLRILFPARVITALREILLLEEIQGKSASGGTLFWNILNQK
jgi:hypothetical protein